MKDMNQSDEMQSKKGINGSERNEIGEKVKDNKGKQMTILTQNRYSRILNGIAWIGAGIFDIPDNPVCFNISMVFVAFAVFLLLRVGLSSTESEDEISVRNLTKARELTMIWTQTIFLVIWVAAGFVQAMPLHVEWGRLFAPTFLILAGLEDLLVGFHFRRLEKE